MKTKQLSILLQNLFYLLADLSPAESSSFVGPAVNENIDQSKHLTLCCIVNSSKVNGIS